MKPLYLAPPVRAHLGSCLRPGGCTLTQHMVDLLFLEPESVILDAGCGVGATLEILQERGLNTVFGLDLETEFLLQARQQGLPVAQADLGFLPVSVGTIDVVLAECVWNLTDRKKVLQEFSRVLRPGGSLAITDIYARPGRMGHRSNIGEWPMPCCFSQATDLQSIENMISAAGFTVCTVEDHTRHLNQTAAEFVFAYGSLQGFWQAVTGDSVLAAAACAAARYTRPGLFLLIARKN